MSALRSVRLPCLVFALACGLQLTGQVVAAPTAVPAMTPVGQVLPDLALAGLNGPPRSLAQFRGRPLVINVWASWCSPCRKEAASLERLAWSKAGTRFQVIGVSTDDDWRAALLWLKQSNATLSHYIDKAPRWPLENTLGASSIPITVLVDAQGRVVARYRGARDWDTPESVQMIQKAFADAARGRAAK